MRIPAAARLFGSAAGAALLAACSGPSASTPPSGARIYAAQCATCHGERGQGVAGKYADPLHGDWSQAKLARYVAANMPEDKPESLAPVEAEAVAAFVYDAFYSPVAQARNHPARVELARLTSRQYAIAVADLLRQVGPATADANSAALPATEDATGLAATYYNVAQRGRFDPAKLAHRGTDPVVDFTFPENGGLRARLALPPIDRPPTPNSREPAGFSAQWRGTLLADETGDHEFVIRTPNSVRVWINAEPDGRAGSPPTLDINVSTPTEPDHRVTVRLLGGRRYPIAIDWWALAEKAGSPVVPAISLRWKPPHGSERPIPARNLSTARTAPTFVVATRFPADDASFGYERGTTVSKSWDEAATAAALEVASHVEKRLDRLAGTRAGDPQRAQKAEAFAARFVAAAFRRPLADEERARFVGRWFAAGAEPEAALRHAVLLALKSPQFLYVDVPSPATVASRLSFGLWDSVPDAPLAAAASADELRTREQIAAHAARMTGDPRTRAKLREFFHQWLQIRYVEDLGKDAALFPGFDAALIDDLRTSLDLFIDRIAWGGTGDFRELLKADYLIANDRIARFYGLPAPADGRFARVAAPAGERAGVLTHPYLLAAHSYKAASSPIHRGVFLTRSVVGRRLKSPPMAVAFDEAQFEAGLTMREKVTRLTRGADCQGCHSVINPLGFSLEWYDAAGRFRREEKGRPIDAVSEFLADDRTAVRFGGARDVAEFAASDERAQLAFVEQLFHHFVKQPARAYGPDTLARLRDSFVASGFNLPKLLAEVATFGALGAPAPALLASSQTAPRP
ncbi:MAG: DUF1592 domain-containing protein [Opitutaceae bacterium]|nr:DUF1592 domain-containing protein [Opitutaceae bacterium]